MSGSRKVAILVTGTPQMLDVAGPAEVFATAAAFDGSAYDPDIAVVAAAAGPVRSSSGLALHATHGLAEASGPFDTLIVAGGPGTRAAGPASPEVAWLKAVAPAARRVASVCTGAFVLAEAGLLDGRRAATHWRHAGAFRRRFPAIDLDDDALFVGDGRVYCSAGVTAGMDLALALVEADMGPEVALAIARGLVLFMRRPGGQSQFSVRLEAQGARSTPVRAAAEWAVENLGRRLTVEAMAERACMAPRTFARAFKRETGVTPGRFLARARIEAARGRLLEGDGLLDAVAADCGFPTAETLRQAFHRAFGIPPGAYRARFRTTLSDKESRP